LTPQPGRGTIPAITFACAEQFLRSVKSVRFCGALPGLFTHCPGRQGELGSFRRRLQSGAPRLVWALRLLGERTCNTCPASRCSVSIRYAKPAVIGFAPMPPLLLEAKAAAPAAANSSATFLRPLVRASACARAPSPRARPFVLVPANEGTSAISVFATMKSTALVFFWSFGDGHFPDTAFTGTSRDSILCPECRAHVDSLS